MNQLTRISADIAKPASLDRPMSLAQVRRAQREYRRQAQALADRLASALRKAPKLSLPDAVAARKPDSAWPVVYYRLVDTVPTAFRCWAHSKPHTLTAHNDEARYCGATHFAAWEPTGELRYHGPVLDALGNPLAPVRSTKGMSYVG